MKRRKGNKWGTGLIIIASVLFLMMKIDWADAFSFWGQNVSLLPGYIESHKRGNFTTQNVINQYLPIVGYVETHYVDTSFDDDPSYKYEPQLEYLTLNMEDETDAVQENVETVLEYYKRIHYISGYALTSANGSNCIDILGDVRDPWKLPYETF